MGYAERSTQGTYGNPYVVQRRNPRPSLSPTGGLCRSALAQRDGAVNHDVMHDCVMNHVVRDRVVMVHNYRATGVVRVSRAASAQRPEQQRCSETDQQAGTAHYLSLHIASRVTTRLMPLARIRVQHAGQGARVTYRVAPGSSLGEACRMALRSAWSARQLL